MRNRPARLRQTGGLRARLCAREMLPGALEGVATAAFFLLLSISECFDMPSPFAVCALTAFIMAGKGLIAPVLGLGVSLLLRMLWGVGLDAGQYAGCALLLLAAFRPPRNAWIAAAYTAAALSPRFILLMFGAATQQQAILCAVSLLTGAGCTPAFCYTLDMVNRRAARIRLDDILCCLLICAVLLAGAGRVAISVVNIGFMLSGAAILACACVGGCIAAVSAGLVCGVSLSLCGHMDAYAVCFAFNGIVAGLFYGRKRGVLCVVYLLSSVFTSYAVRFTLDLPFLAASGAGCLLFLALPRKVISGAYALSCRMSPDAADMEAAYAQFMRAQWTANIRRIAQLLPPVRVPQPDADERLEEIVERLCAGCEHRPFCWHEQAAATHRALRAYFISDEGAPQEIFCARGASWPSLLAQEKRQEQQRALRENYARREREGTRTHLTAISQAMARLSQEGGACDKRDDALQGEAAYLLRRMRVTGRILYALRVSRHITIALRYEPRLTRSQQLDKYCQALSQQLRAPLCAVMRSKDMVLIEETPPLMVECYHLSAPAADGDGENGDSVLLRRALGGVEIAMLSDGMGHGAQAHVESEKTLELLSLCLDAGYTVDAALAAINSVMLSSTDGEQYATVDLCVADLWEGTATLHKLGACPSILISGGSLRVLDGSALPLGILPEINPSMYTFAVAEGDMLIQFSDGLMDACGGMRALEGQAGLLAAERLRRQPEVMATGLMSAAMRRSGGAPRDDVTVLCTLYKSARGEKAQ